MIKLTSISSWTDNNSGSILVSIKRYSYTGTTASVLSVSWKHISAAIHWRLFSLGMSPSPINGDFGKAS
ncbi:hypothetical protein QPK77_06430 [Providencia rettgeri]|nr:hypothetical protein [Providencia rettgeri]MDK3007583.1 hypothetical protein [Providencia rettgeri]